MQNEKTQAKNEESLLLNLKLLRGIRFAINHRDVKTQELFNALKSRLRVCDEQFYSFYLSAFNDIGFRDEKLYGVLFDMVKANFEGMKYTD